MSQAATALEGAFREYCQASSDPRHKFQLIRLFNRYPSLADVHHTRALQALLRDRDIEPTSLSEPGWRVVHRMETLLASAERDAELAALALSLDSQALACTLLEECPVDDRPTERVLTRLRKWLTLSGEWRAHRHLTRALAAQARINGGAWAIDGVEHEHLANADATVVSLYLPSVRTSTSGRGAGDGAFSHIVTRAVADQYEGWPYPAWRRVTRPSPMELSAFLRGLDSSASGDLADRGQILIAGCGTGRQAAIIAMRFPDASITAIDISASSLAFARRQCDELGLQSIRFERLDLHQVAELGVQFDLIYCDGVLHHLPDPEKGWEHLVTVLKEGGLMHVMVYSRLARMPVEAARTMIGDLLEQPMSDQRLREVRRRLLAHPSWPGLDAVVNASDFSTLAGTFDLVCHRHEDSFDIPRVACAIRTLGLTVLGFVLPAPYVDAYRRQYPHDARMRDMASLQRFEAENPGMFARMYDFWCSRPAR